MEVVAAVGGGLISASVESLFEKLSSGELLKFAQEEQMLAELKNWESMLIKINTLLDDAEDKQMTDRGLKIWLDELRDLAFDIEDVLDEFSTEALKLKVMGDSKKNTIKLPTCFNGFSPASFAFKRRMASKTNDITSRLQRITEQEQTLNLTKIARARSNKLKERPPTSSLVQESHTYGRKDDKEAIVRKLLTDEVGDNPVRVIPILGMGGIGKTTLAQLVYNDPRVKACFEIKLWVCVSENFDVVALTRTILQAVIGKIRDSGDLDLNDLNNFDVLQEKLKAKLYRKKFLLVLDDFWEEDYSQWDLLRRPFDSGAHGSKIVITTRNECVASITSTDASAYHVKVLPDTECLSVLALHALGAPNFDAHLDLKDIGEKIVKRCKGLPLAAKVLGGLLRSNKSSREEWEGILTSEMWNLQEASNSILLALKLSYHYLPCHLKRCFVYCAIFPKDYEFDREELVSLWMAEGFLQHPREKKPTEDVGIKYFNDLLSRSFFQSSSSTHLLFVMHDLISDLAQSIAGEICYTYDNKSEDSMLSSKYQKVRHASLNLFEKSQYDVFDKMNSLRTIVGLPIPGRDQEIFQHCGYGKYQYKKVLCKILPKAKSVRVLSLTSPTIFVIPDSIGDLKHIRHLNFSHTSIQRLPESVSFLFNLQALILHNCFNLIELPRKIGNLVNLQHLDIYHTAKLREIPSEIGKLTNLQKLSNFIVRKGDGNTITYLKNLLELRGSLSICGLHNVTDIHAARSANMKTKQNLEELLLEWRDHFFDPLVNAADYDEQNDEKNEILVLQSLQPHRNLKKLTISFYGGSEFPHWVGHSMSSKLLCLTLRHCRKVKLLPPLGLFCFLKELSIDGLDGLETIGPEFYGSDSHSVEPFRSLETLEIKNMPEWREWSHFAGAEVRFPNLQRLVIQNCPKLIGNLPSRLPCGLTHIRVEDCDALESFPIIDSSTSKQCLLEELEIRNCYSFKYFDRNFNFPSSLTRLTIVNCRSLVFLPDGLMVDVGENDRKSHSHLEYLEISGCPLIPSFPTGKFPATLNELRIGGLMHLGSITREMFLENNVLERVEIWNNHNLRALPSITGMQSLRHLSIDNCPALESFPKMGLAIPTLIYLAVQNCPNLLSLPKPELSHLPSLRIFIMSNCRGVVSLTEEGGLSPNLTTLQIRDCENLRQPMAEWGLHRLSSLEILQVGGICDAVANVVSLPDDGGCLLPTSLITLWMEDFMNLESISMGLQMLTSLKYLLIADCPKLRSFPKEAVPPGLVRINLCGCPLLKGDYLKLKNEEDYEEDWPTVEFFS